MAKTKKKGGMMSKKMSKVKKGAKGMGPRPESPNKNTQMRNSKMKANMKMKNKMGKTRK